MGPKYPQLHVRLHSRNPFAMISAVRSAMRRSCFDGSEIDRFTEEALRTEEPQQIDQICKSWARVEVLS